MLWYVFFNFLLIILSLYSDMVGDICLNNLQDKWSSAYDVRIIQSLLGGTFCSSSIYNSLIITTSETLAYFISLSIYKSLNVFSFVIWLRTKHEFPFEHLGSSTVGKSRRYSWCFFFIVVSSALCAVLLGIILNL